jgi:hypothetical protein
MEPLVVVCHEDYSFQQTCARNGISISGRRRFESAGPASMVSSTRRKSVSFVEPADAPASRTRRSGILASVNSPSGKSPAKSALKRPERAAPGTVEADGAFKFKRRKNAHAGATAGAERPPGISVVAEPLPPQPPPVEQHPSVSETGGVSQFPLCVSHVQAAVITTEPPTEAQVEPPSALSASALIEPTLSGAPPELLHALWDICHETCAEAHAPLASVCLAELSRVGLHAAPPADPNARLRAKENLLRRRLAELTAAAEEWDAEAEAGVLIRTAEVQMSETDGTVALVGLPQPPPLEAQVSALRLHLALCADQVELSMLAMERLCGQGKQAQKRLAQAAHQQTFQGCARQRCGTWGGEWGMAGSNHPR